ncbi:MAG: VanZ family protein [Phycicoccus sp.]|nr:VanZ family protein [Phycicoccus sp.]NMM33559.1 VanZ family protein [Phycicoccus sp.]
MLPSDLTVVGGVALLLAPLVALVAALLLRRRFPRSWPLAPLVLISALTVGVFLATTQRMVDDFWRWLYPDAWQVPAVLGVLAILICPSLRRRGFTWTEATWTAIALFTIGLATIPERLLTQLSGPHDAGGALVACVGGGFDRYLPMNLSDIANDMAPNVILYAPLGFIVAVRGLSLRRTMSTALVLSAAVEIYQALFTSRICAPRDVLANVLGTLVGAVTVYLLTRRAKGGTTQPAPVHAASLPR